MSTLDPTPTPLPAAPDWRALLKEMTRSLSLLDKPPHDLLARAQAFLAATTDRTRLVISLATPPAVDGDERLRLVTAGVCSGYIAGHDATVEGHYGDPEEVAADMAPVVLAEAGPAPPAATRKAEHDDGDDAIDRWVEGKSDWIANWGAPRSDIAALIGEALEHWGRSATREAGPQAGAEISTEEWYALKEQLWDQFETVGHQGERFMWFASFDAALDKARAVLARRGGAAVPSKVAPTEEDLYDLAEAFNGDPVPAIRRALELWGGAAVPVPVSERPWEQPGWCDAEDRCWLCGKVEGDWRLMSVVNPGVPHLKYCFSHALPHWALPVPAAAAGEVE